MTFAETFRKWFMRRYIVETRYSLGQAADYFNVKRSDVKSWLLGTVEPTKSEKARVLSRISA